MISIFILVKSANPSSPYCSLDCVFIDRQRDVDKEFFLLFSVMDENMSWYLEENIENFSNTGEITNEEEEEDFAESNKMHGNRCIWH